MTPGDATSASGNDASCPVHSRWLASVASMTTATGVLGSKPACTNVCTICARRSMPINTTSVPPTLARADQSTELESSASWPVTTVTARDTLRCVTGMPAADGAASAELMPGTTSNEMP